MVWIDRGTRSQSAIDFLNASLTKYLKRYLGIPFRSNNKMTHFICQTEPLLNIITRRAFQKSLSIVLPPSIPPIDFPQIDIPIYEPFKIIPSDFWRGRQIQKIPLNRDFRKKKICLKYSTLVIT